MSMWISPSCTVVYWSPWWKWRPESALGGRITLMTLTSRLASPVSGTVSSSVGCDFTASAACAGAIAPTRPVIARAQAEIVQCCTASLPLWFCRLVAGKCSRGRRVREGGGRGRLLLAPAVAEAIAEIDRKADEQPDEQAPPVLRAQRIHHGDADGDAEQRD